MSMDELLNRAEAPGFGGFAESAVPHANHIAAAGPGPLPVFANHGAAGGPPRDAPTNHEASLQPLAPIASLLRARDGLDYDDFG